ncbi:MAG: DUF192 domain-containing protein [Dehalococcoidia bacterium]|nr:DUF192 domain-containing protein [Dehalococcoidia bacterium]
MKRPVSLFLILASLLLVAACAKAGGALPKPPPAPPSSAVSPQTILTPTPIASFTDRIVEGYAILGQCMMTLEIADTADERKSGLRERKSLPAGHGMVFVYTSESKWAFWMKDTLLPLDAVWVDRNGLVVDVQTMIPQPGAPDNQLIIYTPRAVAMYAIELTAGAVPKSRIAVGSQLQLQLSLTPLRALPLCGA